ncbi:hypothetical protein B7463_g4418, partial [Scytalidium lignicola]
MVSSDPGVAFESEAVIDPMKNDVLIGYNTNESHPIAPDQFNPELETTRKEIWSYYAYYIGDNGLSLFNFAPTAFQNLLYQAAGDSETLHFAGADRTIVSIVLLVNGISFAIQSVIFLVLGSFADYGTWRPTILIACSLVAWGVGFGWLGAHDAAKWEIGTGLYLVGLIAYQTTITFWTAAFPGLARNTPEMRQKAEELANGGISRIEYDRADALKRSEISNMAFYIQSIVNDSVENNNYGLSVLVAFASGVWLLSAIPWFLFEKRRPGQKIPAGMNMFMVGFWQLVRAMKQIYQLKQSLLYLIGYFLLGDSLNTAVTVINTLQNQIVAYNSLQLTYLLLAGIAAQAVGIYSFWWAQKHYKLSVKFMFNIIVGSIILLDIWGMIGIWTDKFGFHNLWEMWVYDIYYSAIICPWYSYSQIMISEVTPRGKEFLFFALFSVIGKTSSFIGPLVSTAIIQATPSGNSSTPFYFLFGLSLFAAVIIWFVDVEKSQLEQAEFLAKEAAALQVIEGYGTDLGIVCQNSEQVSSMSVKKSSV